jgi:hypothetical protein
MYQFSWLWFAIGIAAMIAGVLMLRFYKPLTENSGVGNYSKWRLAGLITIGAGFVFMTNVHSFLLSWLVSQVFGR